MNTAMYTKVIAGWTDSIMGGPAVALVDLGYALMHAVGDDGAPNLAYHWESLQEGIQKIADMPAEELAEWVAEAATRRYP